MLIRLHPHRERTDNMSCVTMCYNVFQCVTIWQTRGVTSSDHNAPIAPPGLSRASQWPLWKTQSRHCVTTYNAFVESVLSRQCYNVTMLQCVTLCYCENSEQTMAETASNGKTKWTLCPKIQQMQKVDTEIEK